jgi:DNA-binding NarL/FixJ family response regulator
MATLNDSSSQRIFVVGDHGVVSDALRMLIDGAGFALAGSSTNLPDACRELLTSPAAAILVDVPLGEGEAHQWLGRLYHAQPTLRAAALRAGSGTWLFSVSTSSAIRRLVLGRIGGRALVALLADAVRRGDHTFHELLRRVRSAPLPEAVAEAAPAAPSLTPRERDLLGLLVRGVTANRQLSKALGVSENTVKYHLRNVLGKLKVHRRAEAISLALRHGWVQLEPRSGLESVPSQRSDFGELRLDEAAS